MKDFRDLQVWQKGHALTLAVDRATGAFPRDELYGLTSQVRRACSSIPTNLAEGCGRGSNADFGRFLQIAMGSACESEYHLLLGRDLCYLDTAKYDELQQALVEIKRMLAALILKVRADG